ncbi:MAG: hypothetical protein AAB381_01800 [Patescibacteria group bacterium]
MPNEQKQLILRYAQLVLGKEARKELNETNPDLEKEMDTIRKTLGVEHEAILELAAKNVVDEFNC